MKKPPSRPGAPAASGKEAGPPRATRGRPPALLEDLDIRIARDGTWYYHGTPIGRKPLMKLFASVLERDEDGVYWLLTPAEKGRVEVETAPFVAVELTVSGSGREQALTYRTNVDDVVTADAEHPMRMGRDPETGGPLPYVLVRDRLEALINRAVYYELVGLGVEEEVAGKRSFGVWSRGAFFPLGTLVKDA